MFFIGSLTTFMPYLGTIILMFLFHLVGTPIKDMVFTTKADSSHEISISQSHQFENIESHTSASFDYIFEKSADSDVYIASFELCDNVESPYSDFLSRISQANSNKAPPVFI